MVVDWTRCKTEPRRHQREGVRWLLQADDLTAGRIVPGVHLLADEVGAGKTKQVIDAAQVLFEAGAIDAVVVVAPAPARGVWADPNPALGEVAKHSWDSVPYACREYSVLDDDLGDPRRIHANRDKKTLLEQPFLRWLVTNYEFVRKEDRLQHLLRWLVRRRFWLVCDEAWALKDQHTDQWKATYEIRQLARRVTLLNGTPVADSPLDLNAQMHLLDERILGFPYVNRRGDRVISCADSRFKHYYAGLAPCTNRQQAMKQVRAWEAIPIELRWPRLEELRAKVAPYALRRLTRDCFDLPPVLDPILVEARLKEDTWRVYKQMRDEMVAWLATDTASVARQAVVKGLRLAQITSGFLGGVQRVNLEDGGLDFGTELRPGERLVDQPTTMLKEIGREKLDAMLEWLRTVSPQPSRLLIWCRFRAEIERTAAAFDPMSEHEHLARRMFKLYGQQSRADREAAVAALNPAIEPDEPVGVVGQPAAGGAALNLAGASLAVSLSQDFSLRVYLQKNGRIDRPGQRHRIRYVDVVATGPKGQRTIDHHVLAALRDKENLARWTAATWRQKLLEE